MKNAVNKKKYSGLQNVQKRDGTVVPFDEKRITFAIFKAMQSAQEGDEKAAEKVMHKVLEVLLKLKENLKAKKFVPTVENIQDLVEDVMIKSGFVHSAKSYIIYRQERAVVREKVGFVPEKVKELVAESKQYFRNPLAEFLYYRSYAKWMPEEGRRETWIETVDRYMDFMKENVGSKLSDSEYKEVRQAILSHEAMPSMRLLQFAGKAARKTNICAYNC